MSDRASIGFRLHTGWAMLVAVAEERDSIRVLHRCRVQLLPPRAERFVYHKAADLPLAEAEELVNSIRQIAEATALTNIRTAIGNLKVSRACITTGAMSVPNDLS